MSVGDLARYLMVSRQNLSDVVSRMARDGHLLIEPDGRDRRSRLVSITDFGREVWLEQAQPRIAQYYEQALAGFSVNDSAHLLHYLLRMLENMKRLDEPANETVAEDPRFNAHSALD